MAENKVYLAVGEEATRGTGEVTTVGFVPMSAPSFPVTEFNDVDREEFRGDQTPLGETAVIRMDQKWAMSIEMNMFTEAGTTAGIIGTMLKHYFGKATSTQFAATDAYGHMMYPVVDPFATANLGTKALTFNFNINEGATMKNHPHVGGRIGSLTFDQEAGSHLKVTAETMGQFRDTVTAELGSVVMPAENLRCDFNNLIVYTGTITRTGTGPNFTDFAFGSATQIIPDSISIKIEDAREDKLRLAGVDYPTRTNLGKQTVEFEMTIDLEDPASGFSSWDEFNLWYASASSNNFTFQWDTGTEAGTSENHRMIIDIPIAQRMGGEPDITIDKDPMVTLKYKGLYDATTAKYLVGILLVNSATTV